MKIIGVKVWTASWYQPIKLLSQHISERVYKTLGTSVINIAMSPPSLYILQNNCILLGINMSRYILCVIFIPWISNCAQENRDKTISFAATPLKGRFVVFSQYLLIGYFTLGWVRWLPCRVRNRGKATVKIRLNAP